MQPDVAATRVAPVDRFATILANTRLSDDYHVVELAAPEIAARTQPGQFLMIKPTYGHDPLLRRPFSVFEILRDEAGAPRGISLLSKIVGRGSSILYGIRRGE